MKTEAFMIDADRIFTKNTPKITKKGVFLITFPEEMIKKGADLITFGSFLANKMKFIANKMKLSRRKVPQKRILIPAVRVISCRKEKIYLK